MILPWKKKARPVVDEAQHVAAEAERVVPETDRDASFQDALAGIEADARGPEREARLASPELESAVEAHLHGLLGLVDLNAETAGAPLAFGSAFTQNGP